MAIILMSCYICLMLFGKVEGKDLGVHGHLFMIEEEDFLDSLKKSAERLSKEEIEEVKTSLQNQYCSYLQEPNPLEGLKDATTYRVFYMDPTVCSNREIRNQKGEVIVKKGLCINPLEHITHLETILLFDGTNSNHLEWAKSQSKPVKWVLTKGRPLDLEESEGIPVYFDQLSILVKKFGIKHLPAKISRDGLLLKIEEIPTEEISCKK